MVSIITAFWGNKYSVDDLKKLPIDFCFSDREIPGIKTFPIDMSYKHTWKKMLQNIDLYGEGGSFFSFRVVENILATLQLGNTYKWKITMTPPEVYKYLVATRKIY